MTEDSLLDVRVAFVQFMDHVIETEPLRYAHDRAALQSALPEPTGTPGAHYTYTDDSGRNRDFPIDVEAFLTHDDDYAEALDHDEF